MDLLEHSFVQDVREPMRLIDILPSATRNAASHSFSTRELLQEYFDLADEQYSCRYISICQRNSWVPLQITKPMIELITSKHDIDSSFWELPSCFYRRNLELEEGFCVPFTVVENGPWTEISYTIRYPEIKKGGEEPEWALRQSGIYHRFNNETLQSLVVLFSPKTASKAHNKAEEWLKNRGTEAVKNPFHLHEILFSAYLPAWRQYISCQERDALKISNTTFSTYIDEELQVGYDNLSALVSLEKRFLKAVTNLSSTIDVLNDLVGLVNDRDTIPNASTLANRLKNRRRQLLAFSHTAGYLQQRAQTTAQLLSDTLSFRDQVIANKQNGNMLQLNKSAVFVTTLTLIYVPASFAATLFGMNFFAMDQERSRIVYTPMVWIYVVLTAILTAITFFFYYWLLRSDGTLYRCLAPQLSMADVRKVVRRITKPGTSFEMQGTQA